MPKFDRSDLDHARYKYSDVHLGPDHPKATGVPDSTLLSRREAYEMAPFIDRLRAAHDLSMERCRKAEAVIQELPSNLETHADVRAALEEAIANKKI